MPCDEINSWDGPLDEFEDDDEFEDEFGSEFDELDFSDWSEDDIITLRRELEDDEDW